MAYDRYKYYRVNGEVIIPKYVEIPKKNTDFFDVYQRGVTRFDILSNEYYGDPNYDWLILMANPELGAMEFEIQNGAIIRIPYPLELTLENLQARIRTENQ